MKQIYVGFSKSKKKFAIASWLIRVYQGFTSYSHVYIRIRMKNLPSDKIFHASEGKIQNMSGTQFDKRHEVVEEYCITVDDGTYRKAIRELHEASGDDYGLLQNLGIVYVDLMREFFNKKVSNPFTKGFNCSEFVREQLEIIYPITYEKTDVNSTTPKDMNIELKKLSTSQPRVTRVK